jgi:hypothetical protein
MARPDPPPARLIVPSKFPNFHDIVSRLNLLGDWNPPSVNLTKGTLTRTPTAPPSRTVGPPIPGAIGPGAPAGTPPPGAAGGIGPDGLSLEERAKVIAAGILDPQEAAIARAIQAKELAIQGQGVAAQGVIAALAKLGGALPAAIQQAYSQAGKEQAGYASGLTGAVGEKAQSAAAEAGKMIASLGAPGAVGSDSPAAMNTANYLGGVLPANDLAAEAASRLAEASTVAYAGTAGIAQQALDQMNASRSEIEELRQRGLDLENTRPAEIQKALTQMRGEDRDERALKLQEEASKREWEALGLQKSTINRQWAQTLEDMAWNRTNATGTLWVVKNGKLVNTGRAAPGSAAGRSATSAATSAANSKRTQATAAARLAETNAHNRVLEAQANARLGLSQKQVTIAQQREARLNKKKANGGYSDAEKRQYGKTAANLAYNYYYGTKDKKTGEVVAGSTHSAAEAMKAMLSAGIPYSIAWNAIYQYASQGGSSWDDALAWNPKYKPPAQRNKKTDNRKQ